MCETTGAHSTHVSSSMHGVVSPSHPFCPLRTRILYPPCKQLLAVVVWGAGHSWSWSLTPSSLMHPYLSCSTPFHPTSNCSWQQLGVLCGVGFIISSPPSSLSTHLPLILSSHPPSSSMVVAAPPWCRCCPASFPCCCPWFLLVLCWFWQHHGVLANLQGGGHHISSTCNDGTMLVF
jgi:hypothetical protein